jgi:hypothetical protein
MRLRMAFLSVILLALAGCQTGNKQPVPSAPSPTPVISGHQEREAVQFKAAEAIDVTVKGTSVETPVKAETAKIVKANQSAPASGIETLVKAYEATIDGQSKEIEKLSKQVEALKDAEMKTQARTLRWFGLGAIAIAALLGYARQIQFAAIAGLVGLGSLGLAQLVTQPWFMPAVTGVCAIILVAVGVVIYRSLKQGTLASKAADEAQQIKEALAVIIPVLDDAKSKLGDAFKSNVLDELSKRMDWSEKQVIKSIRKETSE